MKEKVYSFNKKIKGVLERIKKSDIGEENKRKILEFYQECIVRGYSKARILKYLYALRQIAKLLRKPFSKVRKGDVINLMRRVEEKGYSEWTKHDFKAMLKVFFKWLREEENPEEVSWFKTTTPRLVKLPEELLTKEEVMRMVNAAEHIRDKAFILTLYESGCRIGELLTLQIKHVQFDEWGAVLIVNGKIGQRRVRVIASAPKLQQWIENHPLKDEPDASLWVTIGTNSRNKAWTYGTAKEVIKKIARKAGIRKRVYPHLFRHSRATHLANHLTEAQMKQYFGWVQGSGMASVYVHLSGRDVDNALFKLNGMKVNEREKEERLKPKVCPRCKARNSPDAKFCSKCGICLDAKISVQIDELREKADRLMNELIKNPEVLNALLKGIEKLKE